MPEPQNPPRPDDNDDDIPFAEIVPDDVPPSPEQGRSDAVHEGVEGTRAGAQEALGHASPYDDPYYYEELEETEFDRDLCHAEKLLDNLKNIHDIPALLRDIDDMVKKQRFSEETIRELLMEHLGGFFHFNKPRELLEGKEDPQNPWNTYGDPPALFGDTVKNAITQIVEHYGIPYEEWQTQQAKKQLSEFSIYQRRYGSRGRYDDKESDAIIASLNAEYIKEWMEAMDIPPQAIATLVEKQAWNCIHPYSKNMYEAGHDPSAQFHSVDAKEALKMLGELKKTFPETSIHHVKLIAWFKKHLISMLTDGDIWELKSDFGKVLPPTLTEEPDIRALATKRLITSHPTGTCLLMQVFKFSPSDLPPEAIENMQTQYADLFKKYVTTHKEVKRGNRYADMYDDDGDANEEMDNGEKFLEQYNKLKKESGIAPVFDKEFARELYAHCFEHIETHAKKVLTVGVETKVPLNAEMVEQVILDDKDFYTSLPPNLYEITPQELHTYFAKPENKTYNEYVRLLQVFSCEEYYQKTLAALEKDPSPDAARQCICLLGAMGRDLNRYENPNYDEMREKLMTYANTFQNNETLADVLFDLRTKDMENDMMETVRRRSKGKNKEETLNEDGMTGKEDVALRFLSYFGSEKDTQAALLAMMLGRDMSDDVKKRVLSVLLKKDGYRGSSGLIPRELHDWLQSALKAPAEFPWNYLIPLNEIQNLSSSDIREKSMSLLRKAHNHYKGREDQLYKELPTYEEIPTNAFVQVEAFCDYDSGLIGRFNELYKTVASASQKNALLFGVVNAAAQADEAALRELRFRLLQTDFEKNPKTFIQVLRSISCIAGINNGLHEKGNSILSEALRNAPEGTLEDLQNFLRIGLVSRVQAILPAEGITAELIERLWEAWGSLDPLFVYVSKMSGPDLEGTRKLVADMMVHMDPPTYEKWKKWRYDKKNKTVAAQLKGLTAPQIAHWSGDYFTELGELLTATISTDKPEQVITTITSAAAQGHLVPAEAEPTTPSPHAQTQNILRNISSAIEKTPDDRVSIIGNALTTAEEDIAHCEAIKNAMELAKPVGAYERLKAGKAKESDVEFLATTFLPGMEKPSIGERLQSLRQELKLKDEEGKPKKGIAGKVLMERMNDLLPGLHDIVSDSTRLKDEAATRALASADFCTRWGIDQSLDLKNMKHAGAIYKALQEMGALTDLLQLMLLTTKLIATNRIADDGKKKGGETISEVLVRLKKHFADVPAFVQDLSNIEESLAQDEDEPGTQRRLAMVITDNPQILLQIGKYPIGCGSCQNYEGDSHWNKALAGYVADAHTKGMLLIDLNKLPHDISLQIEENGFDAVKDRIAPQLILEACVARSLAKMITLGEEGEGGKGIFLEPTYSSINKGDLSMDRYFNIAAELLIANPMGLPILRGEGDETVTVAKTRNPSGQYEDCGAGNAGNEGMGIQYESYTMPARIIDRFTPVTDADIALAERISSGSPSLRRAS